MGKYSDVFLKMGIEPLRDPLRPILRGLNTNFYTGYGVSSLFLYGEQGVWYDPSGLTTLFQDSSGTTPVTAVEQPVGFMWDKRLGQAINPILQKYGSLSGTTGLKFTTPNATANQITGSIDLRWYGQLGDIFANHYFVSKWSGVNSSSSYLFQSLTGTLSFMKATGGAAASANATVTLAAAGIANNADVWLRTTYDSSTNKVNFYSSTDGVIWTSIGAEISIASGAINNTTNAIEIGSAAAGGVSSAMRIYSAQIYNGVGGTLTVDFCPPYGWTSGTWVSSKTGETWTVGATATVVSFTTSGNHAFQSTSAARPLLSARYNLLTNTEAFDNAAWTKAGVTVSPNTIVAPDGTSTADTVLETATTGFHYIYQSPAFSNTSYKQRFCIKANGRTKFSCALYVTTGTIGFQATIDLTAKTIVGSNLAAGVFASVNLAELPNGWFEVSLSGAINSSGAGVWQVQGFNSSGSGSYAGDTSLGFYIWGADLRVSNDGVGLPPYQRVGNVSVTPSDYDTTGFPLYIKPNGSSQFMVTNNIDFSATDKITVWAGVRKLNDATTGIFVELSATLVNNSGAFVMGAPDTPGTYSSGSRGNAAAVAAQIAIPSGYAAPTSNVLSSTHDIPGNLTTLRINTVNAANATGDKGAGNFGNYPLYLFARGGATLWFGGRMYGMIVRGATSSAAQITSAEDWVNSKTKAY